ncbi:MAG: RDD family protein [Crocinitomicaceae bacterium]|nr:RDD family protein [Crocinitomicaceae bacterium]
MTDLLDSTIKKKTVHDGFSNIQDRVRHLFIDGLIVMISSALILALLDILFLEIRDTNRLALSIIVLIVYMIYYSTFEFYVGFTIGKLLNKTRVINIDDSKPTFQQILIRTLTRLIPFGFITILTPYKGALHDLFSKTRTIRIKKKKFVEVNEI